MGERIRTHDWSSHPLGAPPTWPQPLRAALRVMLDAAQPMLLWWGAEFFCFYNDAARAVLGGQHPGALGRPGRATGRIWGRFGREIEEVMSGRGAIRGLGSAAASHTRRRGLSWLCSLNPIADETAPHGVGGVLGIAAEGSTAAAPARLQATEAGGLQQLFEQSPSFIMVTRGPEHVIEIVNAAHRRMFGSGAWIGERVGDVFKGVDGRRFLELLDKVYATGRTYQARGAKVRYRRAPDAREETRYITFTIAPWVDQDGNIIGVFGDGFDVTEMRRIESALRESDERLRLATQAAAIGIWDFDLVENELRWDVRCKELFGLPPDAEVTYQKMVGRGIHPDDVDHLEREMKAALDPKGSGVFDIEHRVIGIQDGVERWIAAKGVAVFQNGRPVRLIGASRDITQRKQATRRLEILNSTATAVAAELDLDKIAQIVVDAGLELTGAQVGLFCYDAPEVGGTTTIHCAAAGHAQAASADIRTSCSDLLRSPGPDALEVIRSDDVRSDDRLSLQAPLHLLGGSPEVRSYLAVPVVSRSGKARGRLIFGHGEVGAFKPEHETLLLGVAGHAATAIDNARLVQALQTLNANLEERVAAEVNERLEAERLLQQAQKLEAVGQLTGGVAHDFNNLLMVISAGLNMVEHSDDAEHREILLERMREAVRRGATLTEQLLSFSRKKGSKPEVVAFQEHLRSMTGLLDRSLGPNVRVRTDAPDDLAPIYVDPTSLQLAVLNLAVNARDAMPLGGTVIIRARNGSPDNPDEPCISISVIDEGVGMDAETRARMFEPFFTTKDIGKGSGLGLAQVAAFAEQSGGRVEVESEPGRGSRITLVLPRSTMTARAARQPAERRPEPLAARAGQALLVEDNEEVAAMTSGMLEQLGWSVSRVESAEAALRALDERGEVDLVLSDVMMPGGMSGLELAEELRASRPGLPIVLMSGFAAAKSAAKAADLPLIPKPFTIETLAAAVDLARRKAPLAARRPPSVDNGSSRRRPRHRRSASG